MKARITLAILVCSLISLNIFAQDKKIRDKRTNPDLYYLDYPNLYKNLTSCTNQLIIIANNIKR